MGGRERFAVVVVTMMIVGVVGSIFVSESATRRFLIGAGSTVNCLVDEGVKSIEDARRGLAGGSESPSQIRELLRAEVLALMLLVVKCDGGKKIRVNMSEFDKGVEQIGEFSRFE